MNYYDEEITITGPDTKQLNHVKVNRRSNNSNSSSSSGNNLRLSGARPMDATSFGAGPEALASQRRQSMLLHGGNSTDDDGLLQDIIDHDDDDDDVDDDDDDDSELREEPKPLTMAPVTATTTQPTPARRSATQRPLPAQRPPSTRTPHMNLPTAKALDNDSEPSDAESDDVDAGPGAVAGAGKILSAQLGGNQSVPHSPTHATETQLSITPDKWEQLTINQEVKDLFPYILKYAPQHIETAYHLQPFVPEYVPAVGDVDAFLKVTVPLLLQPQRQQEINEHLRKMGLHCLDEPSGEQSEPSLLNMKLRSVLTGSGVNARSASASLIPTAKSPKDIDKWIAEVEQVHMTHSAYDAQPRKDIESLLLDWPRSYAESMSAVQDDYQRCQRQDITLVEYIQTLCQRFGVLGPSETQVDYILNLYTLFALYLAANQAWE